MGVNDKERVNAMSYTLEPTVSGLLSDHIGNTPVSRMCFQIGDLWRSMWLKLESANPAGSLKDRTAVYLIADLENRGLLKRGSTIVESTSGNLGVALAFLCREKGYRFLAVIDPKTTPENCSRMERLGAALELVRDPDPTGGYLLSRLKRVHEICSNSPMFVWTNQYANPANPEAHYHSTAPEIYRQFGGRIGAMFVAVSTGGTLAGVGRYFREVSPHTKIIAVDAAGSVIFGTNSGRRKLTGIGSSRKSDFITPDLYDAHVLVNDEQAFCTCRQLADAGIQIGGSSGAIVFACARYLAQHPEIEHAVCLCPDGGENYRSTIFDDGWMRENGLDPNPEIALIHNIRFEQEPSF